MRVLLQPIYCVTPKVASSEGAPEQHKALLQAQAAIGAVLPLGSHDLADPVVFEVSVADRGMLFVTFGRPV